MELKAVSIDSNEKIFLDGKEIKNVVGYKLEDSADSSEPAKLTVTMYVKVKRVCFGFLRAPKASADVVASTIKDHLRKAADQPMSPEDVKTYREIADQKQKENHIYVSERITNISELEKLMERERIALSALATKLQGKALSENEIKGEIDKILQIQNQVSSFEFCVERRKTKGCIL